MVICQSLSVSHANGKKQILNELIISVKLIAVIGVLFLKEELIGGGR